MVLKIKKLHQNALLPCTATSGSAGYDLHACLEGPLVVAAGTTEKVATGLAIALPHSDCAAFIYARSGLAVKSGLAPANCVGVVDSDYRGELIVALRNYSDEAFTIHHGDRVAQMVIAPVLLPKLLECDELDDTERGAGGFGSTGVKA